ncbi:thioester domain-containing protein [Nocardiopsis synnemataformans]|uniref:thioester domain-containing protein n=1 Tax=Nocardiopsis synnemataformans TaxID=61305 RepID=UPI003EBF301E
MSGILRRYAALLSASALIGTLLGAPAASADDFSRVDRDPVAGALLVLADGREVDTALFSLRVAEHASVRAYTVTADEEVQPYAAYVESAWSDVPEWTETPQETDPADRAHWIVSHSYPAVGMESLLEGSDLSQLDEARAIAGTQAALWHVLEGVQPDPAANDPAVMALYGHLLEGSASAADNTSSRSLAVSPSHVEAVAPEEPLGPLTVHSSGAEPVSVSVRGAPASWLVDADGEQVTQTSDGEQVFLDVDPSVPAGVATLHLHGRDFPLPQGRLFTGRDGVRTRSLVTAEAGSATSSATATFTWHPEQTEEPVAGASPEPVPEEDPPALDEAVEEEVPTEEVSPTAEDRIPEDDLAVTGTWLSGLLIIAGALVVSGLIILVVGRKRRD